MKGNTGEWVKIYFLLKMLSTMDSGIPLTISEIEKNKYGITELKFVLKKQELHFLKFNGYIQVLIVDTSGVVIKTENIYSEQLNNILKSMKKSLLEHKSGFVHINEDIIKQLETIGISNLKISSDYNDFTVKLRDIENEDKVWFKLLVKSQLAGPGTLLNSSQSTNIMYNFNNVIPDISKSIEFSGIKRKLRELRLNGIDIQFVDYMSESFKNRLLNLDSKMPVILAEIVRKYYSTTNFMLADLVENLEDEFVNSISLTRNEIKGILIKNIFELSASGQKLDSSCLLVTINDDLNLEIANINNYDYREKIFNILKLDTSSTKRNDFGYIYNEDNKSKIKLNLQIRYVR